MKSTWASQTLTRGDVWPISMNAPTINKLFLCMALAWDCFPSKWNIYVCHNACHGSAGKVVLAPLPTMGMASKTPSPAPNCTGHIEIKTIYVDSSAIWTRRNGMKWRYDVYNSTFRPNRISATEIWVHRSGIGAAAFSISLERLKVWQQQPQRPASTKGLKVSASIWTLHG